MESEYKDEVDSRLSWTYSHPLAANKMSKQSVSELKRMAEIQDESSGTELINKSGKQLYDRPKFMRDKSLSPAERGTAMHTVMQHISLKEVPTLTAVEHLLEELLELEMISPEQAEAVSIEQIVQFFHSEIGERLLGAKKISREVPFTMGIPAREVYPDWDGLEESVLVQGIVDCVIEEEEGLIILDYKTDTIEDKYPGGFTQAKKYARKALSSSSRPLRAGYSGYMEKTGHR